MNKRFAFNPKLDFAIERFIDAPARLVWEALTQPEHLKEWYMPSRQRIAVETHVRDVVLEHDVDRGTKLAISGTVDAGHRRFTVGKGMCRMTAGSTESFRSMAP